MSIEDCLSDLVDDPEFGEINSRFGRFNFFEALGAPRRELEHSNFLAFLLSPTRPHALGAEPLRRMLRAFIEATPRDKRPVRPLDIIIGDLDDSVVYRERDNIDLLIEVSKLDLVVVIENKVGAKASDGQLERYAQTIRRTHPKWRHLFVFLTPDAANPDHESYTAVSYSSIAHIIEGLISDSTETGEIALVLRHYLEMLRRHVVQDEELKELALRIYERHKDALEFIFDSRPEPGSQLGYVRELISAAPQLALDRQIVSIARFVPKDWENIDALNVCPKDAWTKTGRNLLFEVKSFKTAAYDFSDRILLSLILGPSSPVLREHFFSCARAQPQVFVGCGSAVGKSWATLFSRELLSKSAGAKMDDEQKATAISNAWKKFLEADLPLLTRRIIEFSKSIPA